MTKPVGDDFDVAAKPVSVTVSPGVTLAQLAAYFKTTPDKLAIATTTKIAIVVKP